MENKMTKEYDPKRDGPKVPFIKKPMVRPVPNKPGLSYKGPVTTMPVDPSKEKDAAAKKDALRRMMGGNK
jgi:hypothetical protein